MSVVISIMDKDHWEARTDNIVICLSSQLIWIPRDLWSFKYQMKINGVFRKFSHSGLLDALKEFDFNLEGSICLLPSSIQKIIEDFEIRVPVKERLVFRYPLARNIPIAQGEKIITFNAPFETLKGDRLNQWVGARYEIRPSKGDLKRIERQQILIKLMLEQNFDFSKFECSKFGYTDLNVNASWDIKTFNNGIFKDSIIDNQEVLIYESVSN